MTYDESDYVTARERTISRALAIAMHAAFVLLLVFGVAWQKRVSEPAAVVDLWSSLAPQKQETLPPPKPAPRVEVRPEPRPAPPPKVEPKLVLKPDIGLKDKLEKERKLKEQQELEKKQLAQEKKKEDDRKKAQQLETRKKDDEKQKLEKDRVAQETEAKRAAQEQADARAKLAKEAAAAQSRVYDEYVRQISSKIRRNIVEPPNLQGNPQVEIELRLLPGGEVLESSLRIRRSSGVPAYDQAVERAILKSSPLPLPPDPTLFNMFRELNLRIRPEE